MSALLDRFAAGVCDRITNACVVDLSAWAQELRRDAAFKLSTQERSEEMCPRRFEAYTDCPKCGRLDHHWLREPKPAPTAAEMAEWRANSRTETIEQWGGGVTRTDVYPPAPVDESQFEVIRICTNCQHEWGQQ